MQTLKSQAHMPNGEVHTWFKLHISSLLHMIYFITYYMFQFNMKWHKNLILSRTPFL